MEDLRLRALPVYWASSSLSDVTLIVTTLDELFLFLAAGMTKGLDLGVMRNWEGIFIFLVEGIKTLGFSSFHDFSLNSYSSVQESGSSAL